jgi:hypothetical protein
MSTKATIFHNESFHFYKDVFDNENVYLEFYDLEEASIKIFPKYTDIKQKNKITIKILKKDFQSIVNKAKHLE